MDPPYLVFNGEDGYKKRMVGDPKDTVFQIVISAVLGVSAFLAFCVSTVEDRSDKRR